LFSYNYIGFDNIIIGGDLNFTLSRQEIWGLSAREERLIKNLNVKSKELEWVDVEPMLLCPTWSNNQGGEVGLAKHLDRFFVHHDRLHYFGIYQSWVGKVHCSDHFPIFLEIDKDMGKPGAPFKYNPSWSKDEGFRKLVRDNWKHFQEDVGVSTNIQFVFGLRQFKDKVSILVIGNKG
jgi:hypothetical protein